jgi:mevalonate kinase
LKVYKSSICERFQIDAKITGAGMGGFCVCFLRKTLEGTKKANFLEILKKEDFVLYETVINYEGLTRTELV